MRGPGNLDGTKALFAGYGSRIKAFYSLDAIGHCRSSAVGPTAPRDSAPRRPFLRRFRIQRVEHLCRLIEDLYSVRLPEQARTTFNVGRIEGGTTVNSIAQMASMLYEFRSPSQECLEYMKAQFDAKVEARRSADAQFDVELLGVRPGDGKLDRAALKAFTDRTLDVIRAYYDGELTLTASSTDSNVPLSMGIMANTLGTISGEGTHTREEWMDLDSLSVGLKLALSLMIVTAGIEV